MKARFQELLDKSIAAMMSGIEIYNKPDFKYREEAFSILAINAWELLLKSRWLRNHKNQIRSLYVKEKRLKANGEPYKHPKIKMTASGNPFTHSLDFLTKRMRESGDLPDAVHRNIIAMCEIRDSSVHFYNRDPLFIIRLQEIGSATVRNYMLIVKKWFEIDFNNYNFYLMPLAFIGGEGKINVISLTHEERNIAQFFNALETESMSEGDYAVSLNINLNFSKSKARDAILVRYSKDPDAIQVQLTEEQIKNKYPLNYKSLTDECVERYVDFKRNKRYHEIRKPLKKDRKYCYVRHLDPDNPSSAKQEWFSRAIFNVLDKHYERIE